MAASTHSFIDIAALDPVRRHFAAGDSVIVLTDDLTQVIWANGPGAALLGFAGIEAAIGAEAGLSRSARRQIEATPGYPEIGSERPITARLASGLISQMTVFRASRLVLPGGETAIVLAVPFGASASRSEEEIAARAIDGFHEAGNYLAVLDASGRVLAATAGFDQLGIAAADLSRLAHEIGMQPDRLLKRIVRVAGHTMPVGVARLRDEPALHLLVTVDERQFAAEPLAAPAAVIDDSQMAPATTPEADEAETAPAGASAPPIGSAEETGAHEAPAGPAEQLSAPEAAQSEAEADAADPVGDEALDGSAPSPEAEDAAITEPGSGPEAPGGTAATGEADATAAGAMAEAATPGQHDSWYFTGSAAGPDAGAAEAVSPAERSQAPRSAPAAIDRAAAPVRFVWRTDSEGRFTAVSPEFVAAVGVPSSDIAGKSFVEVARDLGLDPDGEIAALLERRDTWSGRSVLWPVAGTELVAPVDLAALPAYDRERRFEGFRGFGVVRLADAQPNPRRTAGVPADGEATPAEASEAGPQAPVTDASGIAEDPFRGEVPVLDVSSPPRQRRYSDKVIRLAEHRPPANDKGLSPIERIAFREIGEHLKRTSSEARPEAAEPDEAAPDALAQPAPDAGEPRAAASADAAGEDQGARPTADRVTAPEQADGEPTAPADVTPVDEASDEAAEESPDVRAEAASPEPADAGRPQAADGEPAEPAAALDSDAAEPDSVVASESPSGSAQGGPAPAVEELPASAKPAAARNGQTAKGEAGPYVSRSLLDFVGRAPGEPDDRTAGDARGASSEAVAPRRIGFLPSAFAERRVDTSILAQLPIPVLIHSGDTLHYANDAFFELTGYASIDQLATHGGLGALLSGPAQDRREGDNRVLLRRRDGGELPVSAYLQSVPWIGGKALLLTLTRQAGAGDAAREKELEARLAELRTILDTATDGVVLIDNDGIVRSISRPAEALFGYEGEQIVGKPFTALFAIESQRAAQDYLAGLSGTGVASVLNDGREVIGREAQGRFIPLFMTIGRLPGDGGYCAVLRDITPWKRAEEDLTQARAQAERTSSQKSDFLARVSHEIRTPLNAIIGFSELMLDEKFGPVANDRYRDYLRDINRSGNHVLDLVNDLLDISKIEAGQQEMDYEAISLNDALTETVAMMQPQANRERVIIRSSFASKLPEVVADLRSVRQIALNILSNAVRYTQAGGQVIVSTAYEPNGEVVMRVRDTGIGMTPSEIEQALKPFKQVNALKRARGDGTGLGLPLTKAMVEANRAKFAIYSTPGEGTLVEVTFPSTRVLAG